MIKIAMIGAGSVVFSRNLTGDILGCPEFRECTISYMDIDEERLQVAGDLCRKVAKAVGANPTIETTTDRRKALAGADFVINMVQIGGFDSTLVDFEVPRKYGLNFTIADTTGPGGFFRALRTFPMLSGMCRDMMDVCPRAFLLNYSNPMSMNMQTVFRTSSINAVGLCHSVQGTFDQLMGYIGEKPADVDFICAGINHMAFYLKIEKDGVDLYPRLFKAMEDPQIFSSNKVRFELMKRLGHFITESSEHNAEYNPYFIPRGKAVISKFSVPIDEYLRRCDGIVDEFDRLKVFSKSPEPMKDVCRSHEYGSLIIQGIVNKRPTVIYGNMPNRGVITNLPASAIVEGPTLVDGTGLHLTHVGELPPQLVGYMQPHIIQHELFIRAATEGRRDHVYQAAMFDPLTAATLTTDQIVEMCDELIAAHGDALPKLDAKTLVPTSGKTFPKVDGKVLRQSWDDAQAKADKEYIREWHILGAFPTTTDGTISTEMATALDADVAKRKDGSVDLAATWQVGAQAKAAAGSGATQTTKPLSWKKAEAGKQGFVDLGKAFEPKPFALGYAYTEVDSVHARETVLSCASRGGIKVWLNGEAIHAVDGDRRFQPGEDAVAVRLKAGKNRILVKLAHHHWGWGFSMTVPPANF
ncbi:MAG: alpha-glucosidase/alpha-galactosidase [Planctomycetes bacterium]|nr:alpha-glucosidase/alpha-galactosidase [Planctomycetota bacterium]